MPYEATTANPVAAQPRPMLDDAFAYAEDRLDRAMHVLGNLNGTIMRAGAQLEPILTDGRYHDDDTANPDLEPTPEDRRSSIAKRVATLGQHVDRLADIADSLDRRLEAILDASEV